MQNKKIILITGASSGIGRSTAIKFAEDKDFKVYVASTKIEKLKDLENLGCIPVYLDLRIEKSMMDCVNYIYKESGTIDILINNAGYGQNGVVEELTIDSIRNQFEVNVFGLIRMCQLVLPKMRIQKNGRIINISSVGADFTAPGASAYHASKYALESFTDGLRMELSPYNIKVILIKPGGVYTNFMNFADSIYPTEIPGNSYKEFRTKFKLMTEKIFNPNNKFYGVLSADVVASEIYVSAKDRNPKTRYRVGVTAKIIPLLKGVISDRMFDKFLLNQLK